MKPTLKIAHVALQLDVGGLERLLVEFARHVDRDRFEQRFVSLSTRGELSNDIEACGWPVTALNEPPGLRPGMILKLAKLFREWNIDVVHTHNTKPLLYAGPAARLARVGSVIHSTHGPRSGSSRLDTFVFVQACRVVDRIACVSKDIAEIRQAEGIPAEKISTVANGIDVSRFAYQGPVSAGPAILVARLRPEKNIETLLRATAIVVKQHPTFQVKIAGDGECESALKQLANELNIAKNVQFLGNVNDVPALLKTAGFLVSSSLAEGMSLSLLEAMAIGLPVVATKVGGNMEVIVEGQTGLLVPPSDPVQLADAMMKVWCNSDLSQKMGEAGRQRVETQFDVRRMIANYESIYEDLARRPSAKCAAAQVS